MKLFYIKMRIVFIRNYIYKKVFSLNKYTSILLSLSLFSIIHADDNKTKLFMDKYIKKDSKEYRTGKNVLSEQQRAEMSKGVDMHTMSFQDTNNTSYDINLTTSDNMRDEAERMADEVNTKARSKEFKKKVDEYEEYLLNDKELGFKEEIDKLPNLREQIDNGNGKYAGTSYKNKYLAHDERLIVAISSSIPIETVKNYFDSLTEVYSDVVFVLNGLVDNDVQKMRPTVEYTTELLKKRNQNTKNSEEDRYLFRVDINPKIFTKYSLEKVPAIIFVKNYNPYSEIQGNGEVSGTDGLSEEDVYIAYGDSNIKYVLEKINKKAKSDGLKKLIKNINKGFFNE